MVSTNGIGRQYFLLCLSQPKGFVGYSCNANTVGFDSFACPASSEDGREKPEHPQRDSFGSHPTASSGSRKLDTREAGDGAQHCSCRISSQLFTVRTAMPQNLQLLVTMVKKTGLFIEDWCQDCLGKS
eukprot:4076367-Amphidinium_carterae.1